MHKRRTSRTDLLRSVYTLRATFPHGSTSRLVPLSLSRLQTQPKRHEGSRGKAESSAASNCLARTFSMFFRDCFPFLERRGRVPVGAKAPPQHTRHLGSSEVVSPIRVVTHPPPRWLSLPANPRPPSVSPRHILQGPLRLHVQVLCALTLRWAGDLRCQLSSVCHGHASPLHPLSRGEEGGGRGPTERQVFRNSPMLKMLLRGNKSSGFR